MRYRDLIGQKPLQGKRQDRISGGSRRPPSIEETAAVRSSQAVRYVHPVPRDKATGLLAAVYEQMAHDFFVAAPLVAHSPSPELTAGAWSIVRESLIARTTDRARREAVAAAVAQANQCPYCVDVHTVMLRATSGHTAPALIREGRGLEIPDAGLRALVDWASATGRPEPPPDDVTPFSPEEAPHLMGTAVAFHYLTRVVNVLLDEDPLALPSPLQPFRGMVHRIGAATLGRQLASKTAIPGESLRFLPDVQLPEEFSWASANSSLSGAFAGFASLVDQGGVEAVPVRVRTLVQDHLRTWSFDDPGLSRRWVEDLIVSLQPWEGSSARLALLTAIASYQVDQGVVEEFRSHHPTDEQLVATVAWAAFAAARRVSSRLSESAADTDVDDKDPRTQKASHR